MAISARGKIVTLPDTHPQGSGFQKKSAVRVSSDGGPVAATNAGQPQDAPTVRQDGHVGAVGGGNLPVG